MITLGLIPAGSLIVGTLAAAISLSRAYVVVGVAVLAITAGVAAANRALRKL
jgi:hypothetical protein